MSSIIASVIATVKSTVKVILWMRLARVVGVFVSNIVRSGICLATRNIVESSDAYVTITIIIHRHEDSLV